MSIAYVALGSNLGDKEQNIRRALELMEGVLAEGVAPSYYGTLWGDGPAGIPQRCC